MKTAYFLRNHGARRDGAKWALSVSSDMAVVWEALVDQGKHEWLLWTATRPGVFPYSVLRKLACRFVRETLLYDGRTVWNLLTNDRSRKAVYVAEVYADGKATADELSAARAAARDESDAAYSAARAAYATYSAAHAAAWAAAVAAASAVAAAVASAVAAAAGAAVAVADADAADAAAWAAYAAAAAAVAAACRFDSDADAAAAKSAQVKMIAELGNPFKKGARK